jgi:hypothetical protein
MKTQGACTIMMAQGAIHSPLGTTSAGVGIGPCAFRTQQDDTSPKLDLHIAMRFGVNHRAFFAEHWFLTIESSTVNLLTGSFYKSDAAKISVVQRTNLGIGYYQTNVEKLFANIWNF